MAIGSPKQNPFSVVWGRNRAVYFDSLERLVFSSPMALLIDMCPQEIIKDVDQE